MSELKEIREKAFINGYDVIGKNKEKIKEAYDWIMKLARIAHRKGLFALEYEASFIPKDLPLCSHIVKMIELICDGTEPDFVEERKFLTDISENVIRKIFLISIKSI